MSDASRFLALAKAGSQRSWSRQCSHKEKAARSRHDL